MSLETLLGQNDFPFFELLTKSEFGDCDEGGPRLFIKAYLRYLRHIKKSFNARTSKRTPPPSTNGDKDKGVRCGNKNLYVKKIESTYATAVIGLHEKIVKRITK